MTTPNCEHFVAVVLRLVCGFCTIPARYPPQRTDQTLSTTTLDAGCQRQTSAWQAQRLLAEAKAGVSSSRPEPAANGGASEAAAQAGGPDPRLRAPERQYVPVRP